MINELSFACTHVFYSLTVKFQNIFNRASINSHNAKCTGHGSIPLPLLWCNVKTVNAYILIA